MQNNRHRPDFADAQTDLSTGSVTLLIFKKKLSQCVYTGMPNMLSVSQAAKINWFSNVIGLPFIMLVTANNKDTMGNHEGESKTRSLGQIIEKTLCTL